MTKAEMLEKLDKELKGVSVLPLYTMRYCDFLENGEAQIKKIRSSLIETRFVIIRSSSRQEDTDRESNAGKYTSILHVPLYSDIEMIRAIEAVYSSYDTYEQDEEILIQPMLEDVLLSGVVFTKDIETFADYYSVNYQEGTDTAAVTSGSTNDIRTYIQYKNAEEKPKDKDIAALLEQCRRIEVHLHNNALDIEFAVTRKHRIVILQVRPIAKGKKESYDKFNLDDALYRIYKKVKKLGHPHPFLLGDETCFGVMPDWNPAEILGIRPKKLAISLYKELITDQVWAQQRKGYGYRDLTSHPLMVLFCGIPYIDTRITFNSFIPEKLQDNIAKKLVNYYLCRLAEYPAYHDKIEFEIVFSCYYLGVPDKLRVLQKYGFNENELKRIEFSLLELTNQIIHPVKGLYKRDIWKAEQLEHKYSQIMDSGISVVDKIYWLLEICKEYGTLPFAGIARAGFIGVQFLDSFVEIGIINQEQKELFMNSLHTITHKMNADLTALHKGEIEEKQFLQKYGHIRPGTYDILSPRYDEAFSFYFGNSDTSEMDKTEFQEIEPFSFSDEIMMRIDWELEENGLHVTSDELIIFIKEAIEKREYIKFIFTKLVSGVLKLISQLGERFHIPVEDMAYLDVSLIKQLYSDLYFGNVSDILANNIKENKRQYQCARMIKLPAVIVKPQDVYGFYLLKEEPNYITQKRVIGLPESKELSVSDLTGKIAFIQSADPGFDYLFSKNINGLVTQFGGANSHMAIRCAELGIPAVIGCGEQNFKKWMSAGKVELDCQKKQVICWF